MKPFHFPKTMLFAMITAGTGLGPAFANEPAMKDHDMSMTSPAAKLDQDMRKLWSEHVIWTRDYIIAALGDHSDLQAATNRLMRNQEDIGNAVGAYYGKPAGDQLTKLLKEHISISADLVKAAKAGNQAAKQSEDKKWHQNAQDIAEFLSKANPNWPKATLVEMMNTHLATTTDELTARLDKKWDDDTKAFDAVYNHILGMADALSEGIVKQFPEKFAAAPKLGKN